ncbi:MAG: hypothetical protein KIT73_11070 [Burkholderiales bacterium]|nr:hypothetical protein [Burkholderiales bacterium]
MLRTLLLFWLSCLFGPAVAAPVQTAHADAELIADHATAARGQTVLAAVRIAHAPGWHTYWRNPGDSGLPTRIAWTLPDGWSAGPILWPVPQRIPVGPLTNYGYEGETLLLTELQVPSQASPGPVTLSAKIDWLICKEICLPGGATVTLDLTIGSGTRSPHFERLRAARAALPAALRGWHLRAAATDDHIVIDLEPDQVDTGTALTALEFFPDTPDVIDNPSAQRLERTAAGYRLSLIAATSFSGKIPTLSGLLVATPALEGDIRAATVSIPWPGGAPARRAASPTAAMSAADITAAARPPVGGLDLGLGLALVMGFVGGLVLNLMPCVFPIVSIKVLGFVQEAHGSDARVRSHGLAFAAGIIVSFWVVTGVLLALRASGAALGWGYQLQSPLFVAGLSVLFLLLALNLSGLFEIGAGVQSLAGRVKSNHGLSGAFLSGVLATAVATPCTAPLMGAALGFALTQPAAVSMMVFTLLALGTHPMCCWRFGRISRDGCRNPAPGWSP